MAHDISRGSLPINLSNHPNLKPVFTVCSGYLNILVNIIACIVR